MDNKGKIGIRKAQPIDTAAIMRKAVEREAKRRNKSSPDATIVDESLLVRRKPGRAGVVGGLDLREHKFSVPQQTTEEESLKDILHELDNLTGGDIETLEDS